MKRLTTSVAAAALLVAVAPVLSAQNTATQEPHHRVVLYTNDVRVFDVTLPPGEATADHSHEHDIVLVAVGSGATRTRRAGETYRIENTDAQPYRAIEVESMHPASPAQGEAAFTINDVRLKAGAPATGHTHKGATVVVLVEGAIENSGNGGESPARLQQPGRWLLITRGQSHNMEAVGSGDAHLVEIEVR